jgi:DNA-damage-inducible protein J
MHSQLASKRHQGAPRLVRDAVVRARVSYNLKHDAENILHHLGLSMSEAISLYLAQITLSNGIPFEIKVPNKITLKTFEDTDKDKNVVKAKNVREIFEKAGL